MPGGSRQHLLSQVIPQGAQSWSYSIYNVQYFYTFFLTALGRGGADPGGPTPSLVPGPILPAASGGLRLSGDPWVWRACLASISWSMPRPPVVKPLSLMVGHPCLLHHARPGSLPPEQVPTPSHQPSTISSIADLLEAATNLHLNMAVPSMGSEARHTWAPILARHTSLPLCLW